MSDTEVDGQLLEFLYACPVGLIECDADGAIGMLNPYAMQHLLPMAGSRDVTNLFEALEQHAPEVRNLVASFARSSGRVCENHRIHVDLGSGRGGALPKVLACTIVKLGPKRLIVTISDVSVQVSQEGRLRQADAWFATLLGDINHYSLVSIGHEGEIVVADEAFGRKLGHVEPTSGSSLADILGHDPLDGSLQLKEQLALATRDGWHLQEAWQQKADGSRYWCQRLVVMRSHAADQLPATFLVVLRDVPRQQSSTDDLRRLLTSDHLTGSANRMHFGTTLEREVALWRELRHPVSLVVLDLDHFKAVNDTRGHPTGDLVLRRVAEACTATLSPKSLFARMGGEEFAVILPGFDRDRALAQAELFRSAIAGLEIQVGDSVLRVTASLGCATLEEADGSADELMKIADARLYAAKEAGRDRVHGSDVDPR